jgi:RNA polymerase sigma-70 factor (ECF subfamily)
LYGAVRNRALHLVEHVQATTRRDHRYHQAVTSIASPLGTARVEEQELRVRLAQTIDALPPRCRAVFLLSRARRLSQREIADILGIALPTVKAHLARAFRSLEDARRAYERGEPAGEDNGAEPPAAETEPDG